MTREIKDLSASVRQKLYNLSKARNRPFDEITQYFAMERFLRRLGESKYKDRFILKGALIFTVWEAPQSRATRDIDLLGYVSNTVENLSAVVREICNVQVEADGLTFKSESIVAERIKEDADYEGVRVSFTVYLGKTRIPMQIDIGFGDSVFPDATAIDYPVLLDLPSPMLKGYPRETVVAEKLEAMVKLGQLNSRMKDFYDIWLLAEYFDFDGSTLKKAIVETFANRKTELTPEPFVFSEAFTEDTQKHTQWAAFLRRTRIESAPKDLNSAIETLKKFLLPIIVTSDERKTPKKWIAPGPWSN